MYPPECWTSCLSQSISYYPVQVYSPPGTEHYRGGVTSAKTFPFFPQLFPIKALSARMVGLIEVTFAKFLELEMVVTTSWQAANPSAEAAWDPWCSKDRTREKSTYVAWLLGWWAALGFVAAAAATVKLGESVFFRKGPLVLDTYN